MRGRLNLFQTMMLRWRDVYPYAAVHMVRVMRPCEPQRLRERIEALLESAGLTGLILDRRRARFEFRGGPAAIELKMLHAGDDTLKTVEAEIERQLNTPFPREGAFSPFRFFAVDHGTSFDLGLAYDHFLAGGDSIAVLLGHCLDEYCTEAPAGTRSWMPRLYPHTYRRLFLRHAAAVVRGLAHVPSLAASCRRSWRAPCRADRDGGNGFLCFRVDRAGIDALRRTANSWQVTIGDLFLAMLLRALDPVTAERRAAPRRRELGVASIMNLRSELESDADATFGQFLSSLRVSHPVPVEIGLRQLADDVHAEANRIRTRRLYLHTLLALGASGLGWRFLSTDRRRRFLAKHYPLWAGISAVHVDPLWEKVCRDLPAREYLRAVSTGPLAPLVFAITTLGDAMWLGVSFRTADVSQQTAERVARNFLHCIASLI
jgi:hypothetical protein